MKVLPLPSQEKLRELFDYDPHTGVLRWKVNSGRARVGAVAGTPTNAGYLQVRVDRQIYLVHRIIFKLMTGRDPYFDIDHADRNPFNNAWHNIREASRSENNMNRGSYGSVHLKGVLNEGKRFRAQICVDRKPTYIGTYNTAEEAHEAWAKAYRELHGSEFARTK